MRPTRSRLAAWAALALLSAAPAVATAQQALVRAHAHNDYRHPRPLLDALEHGFNSVEADVFLVDGELLVAHDPEEVDSERTLERLYLAPLREQIRRGGGVVHRGAPPLLLLIDVKSEAAPGWRALNDLLRRYADIVTIFAGEAEVAGPVVAVVSGERAPELMRASAVRFAAMDGRVPDLTDPAAPGRSLLPLVSEDWKRITDWKGTGDPPPGLAAEVRRLVELAHARQRRLRFWGTPDLPVVWRLLRDAGVDLINTDDLAGLRAFLLAERGR